MVRPSHPLPREGENIELHENRDGTASYRARVSARIDGKQVTKRSTFRTLTEARRWQASARAELQQMGAPGGPVPTVSEAVQAYLATRRVRTHTMRGYLSAAKRIQDASIGALPVDKLREEQVERWVATLAERDLARASVQQSLHLLKASLDRAVRLNQARRNEASFVQAAGAPRPDTTSYTTEEWQRLKASLVDLPHPWQAGLALSLMGLRRSEVLGLRWKHVDLETRSLSIEKSRTGDEVNDTKTKRGNRRLPLAAEHLAVLRELRAAQDGAHGVTPETFLITVIQPHPRMKRPLGDPVAPERMEAWWKALCRLAEVPDYPLKTARSSSVTLMREAGVPDVIVAFWHGHNETVMRESYTAPPSFDDLRRYWARHEAATE